MVHMRNADAFGHGSSLGSLLVAACVPDPATATRRVA